MVFIQQHRKESVKVWGLVGAKVLDGKCAKLTWSVSEKRNMIWQEGKQGCVKGWSKCVASCTCMIVITGKPHYQLSEDCYMAWNFKLRQSRRVVFLWLVCYCSASALSTLSIRRTPLFVHVCYIEYHTHLASRSTMYNIIIPSSKL